MTRPRLTADELNARLDRALAIADPDERRRATKKAREAIRGLQFRSTLPAGERQRVQCR